MEYPYNQPQNLPPGSMPIITTSMPSIPPLPPMGIPPPPMGAPPPLLMGVPPPRITSILTNEI